MTIAESERTPIRASWPATFASGGPSSTRMRALGVSSSIESPCPTSRKVTRRPAGGSHVGRRPGRDPHRHGRARPRPRRARRADVSDRGVARAASPPSHEPSGDGERRERERRPRVRSARREDRRRLARRARARLPPSPRAHASPAAAVGETGSTTAASSPKAEHERSRREREHVRRHRVERRLAEVEQDDRRGRETARECDGERIGDARRAAA